MFYSGYTYSSLERWAHFGVPVPYGILVDAAQDLIGQGKHSLHHKGKISLFRHYTVYKWIEDTMPTKRKKNSNATTRAAYDYKSTRWANVRLSAEDEPEIIANADNITENLSDLLALFIAGVNISLKRRPDGETVSCVLIFPAGTQGDTPVGLSAFAPDAPTVISAALYKYYTVAGEDLRPYVSEGSSAIG